MDYAFYLAAPFFNDEQRGICYEIEKLAEELKLPIFSPRHDAGLLSQDSTYEEQSAVFGANIVGLERSKSVLARIDDFDPGTIWEMGYAFGVKIPVVAFSTVPGRGLNLMLAQSCIGFISGLRNIRAYVGGDSTVVAKWESGVR